MEILYVNKDARIIYHTGGGCGATICKTDDEFNNMILIEKKKISNRGYILNRFEHWEVDDLKQLRTTLLMRCRNETEKKLVKHYIDYIGRQ